MIVFRQLDDGYADKGVHWNVEVFSDDPHDRMFPCATAYVVTSPDGRGAQLKFVLVADQWRSRGLGKAALLACRARWPNLQADGRMNDTAANLLRSTGFCDR
jgi:hypothetical protein